MIVCPCCGTLPRGAHIHDRALSDRTYGDMCECGLVTLIVQWVRVEADLHPVRVFNALIMRIRLELETGLRDNPREYVVHVAAPGTMSAMEVGGGEVPRPVRMRDVDLSDAVRERTVHFVLHS